MILTGNDFDQMTGIMRANVNVVKKIRENDGFSIKRLIKKAKNSRFELLF